MIKSADKISRKLETHLDWQILQIPNEINSTGPILFLQNQVPEKRILLELLMFDLILNVAVSFRIG